MANDPNRRKVKVTPSRQRLLQGRKQANVSLSQSIEEVGGVLSSLASQIGQANDAAVLNKAEADARLATDKVLTRTKQGEFDTLEKFDVALVAALDTVESQTPNVYGWDTAKRDRVFLANEVSGKVAGGRIILEQANSRGRRALYANLESLHLREVRTTSIAHQNDSMAEVMVQEAHKNGFIKADQIPGLLNEISRRSAVGMIRNNPIIAYHELDRTGEDGKFSVFKHLRDDQRAQLMKSASEGQNVSMIDGFKACIATLGKQCTALFDKYDSLEDHPKNQYNSLYKLGLNFGELVRSTGKTDLGRLSNNEIGKLIAKSNVYSKYHLQGKVKAAEGKKYIAEFLDGVLAERRDNPRAKATEYLSQPDVTPNWNELTPRQKAQLQDELIVGKPKVWVESEKGGFYGFPAEPGWGMDATKVSFLGKRRTRELLMKMTDVNTTKEEVTGLLLNTVGDASVSGKLPGLIIDIQNAPDGEENNAYSAILFSMGLGTVDERQVSTMVLAVQEGVTRASAGTKKSVAESREHYRVRLIESSAFAEGLNNEGTSKSSKLLLNYAALIKTLVEGERYTGGKDMNGRTRLKPALEAVGLNDEKFRIIKGERLFAINNWMGSIVIPLVDFNNTSADTIKTGKEFDDGLVYVYGDVVETLRKQNIGTNGLSIRWTGTGIQFIVKNTTNKVIYPLIDNEGNTIEFSVDQVREAYKIGHEELLERFYLSQEKELEGT